MNFLDKNNEILFQTMQSSDIEETANCISQVFSSFEPITKALKISFNEFYRLAVSVCQKAADEELSLIAKDQKTGEIVGFIISKDFMTVYQYPLEGIDHKFEAVFSLLSELEENYRSSHAVEAGQVLHIFLLGVQEKYTKRHIATTLVKENLNLAKHHCSGIQSFLFEVILQTARMLLQYTFWQFLTPIFSGLVRNAPFPILNAQCPIAYSLTL